RLNAKDLATSGAVTVSVVDPAQTCNGSAAGTPCTATGASTFSLIPVRPTSTASVPDDIVQGKLSQQTRVIIDGGYFGPNGTLAADRKSTRLNSSHQIISYAVFCLK